MGHFKASGGAESSDPAAQASVNCAADPIVSLKTMFVDMVQAGRIAKGQCPALRPVFLKPHGVAAAQFQIRPDLPEPYRVGLFSEPGWVFDAWVRFSSDTLPSTDDYKTTLGMGIKLFDVPGEKLIGNPDAPTFDFILQNFDVFFVDTASDMCAFTQAGGRQPRLRSLPQGTSENRPIARRHGQACRERFGHALLERPAFQLRRDLCQVQAGANALH